MLGGMSVQIAVRLPEEALERLDAAIARGTFPNRAAAVRHGLDRLLREEREREIEAAYRRAYAGREPDEEDRLVGQAGLEFGSRILQAEEEDAE